MIKKVNIKDVDYKNTKYHFTLISNYENISRNGLVAQKGSASQLVDEQYDRVYLSEGIKGLLEIRNSFIFKFSNLRICDIPNDYRIFFDIKDFSSVEKLSHKQVYDALIKRFKSEIYFVVDAKEGEDYLLEDVKGLSNNDIKCKVNHNFASEKLQLLVTDNGCSAFDVLQYYYKIYINSFGKKDYVGRYMNSSLASLMDYYETGIINEYNMNYFLESEIRYNQEETMNHTI